MVTTVEALQNLYVTVGGNIKDVENLNTIPDMIIAISELEPESTEERTVTSNEIDTIVNSIS